MLLAGKYSATIVSMFLTIAGLGYIYEWDFATGVVLMLFIHELGHVLAAKRKGLPVTAPVFIPFVGAIIQLKRNPRDVVTEAYVAMGGPLIGSLGAVCCALAGWAIGDPMLVAVAYVGLAVNLLNLIPVHPLDGGRIASAVTRWLWLGGLAISYWVIRQSGHNWLYILWGLFVIELCIKFVRFKGKTGSYSAFGLVDTPVERLNTEKLSELLAEPNLQKPSFQTFSTMDGRQRVRLSIPALWLRSIVIMPEQGLITDVSIKEMRIVRRKGKSYLRYKYRIVYTPHEDDIYYKVPAAVRWRYGLAYVGLSGCLAALMYGASKLQYMLMTGPNG